MTIIDTKRGGSAMSLSETRDAQELLSSVYNSTNEIDITQSEYYKQLVAMRSKRQATFINDRGPRHVKNRRDKIGVSYAFWLKREKI